MEIIQGKKLFYVPFFFLSIITFWNIPTHYLLWKVNKNNFNNFPSQETCSSSSISWCFQWRYLGFKSLLSNSNYQIFNLKKKKKIVHLLLLIFLLIKKKKKKILKLPFIVMKKVIVFCPLVLYEFKLKAIMLKTYAFLFKRWCIK